MANFLKNYLRQRRIASQIEKYQAKAELMKYKTILQANKSKIKTTALTGATKQLQAAEDLKALVAETLPQNTIVQILNNEMVQQLIKAASMKLMSGGAVSTADDELITMYKKLPTDIKGKVKDFALAYIGQK
jgi:hypothetical protein